MKYLMCHPFVAGKIWTDAKAQDLTGIKVIMDPDMPIYLSKRVVARPNPFLIYEESDWDWLTYFGFTKAVEDTSRLNIMIVDSKPYPTSMILSI